VCCAQEVEADYDSTTIMAEDDDGEPADRLHETGVRRSLRVSVVAALVEAQLRLDRLTTLANSTGVFLHPVEEVSPHHHTRHDMRIALVTTHDTRHTTHDTRHTTHDTRHTTHDTRHTRTRHTTRLSHPTSATARSCRK
jgi:Tfp pilus assembly protein PilE